MMETGLLLLSFALVLLPAPSAFSRAPYAMRISCGARANVRSPPTNTLWFKDFAYTGGVPAKATRPAYISPFLHTLRYFPLSDGPDNCYLIPRVPRGRYAIRIFLAVPEDRAFGDAEPLFDVSVEGTLVYSLQPGWSSRDNHRSFIEALAFLNQWTASLCFHSTGHGDPAILAIEILELDNRAYYFPAAGPTILRTHARLSCGAKKSNFGSDYGASLWGGDRYWDSLSMSASDWSSIRDFSTQDEIKGASRSPNFYPEALYKTALVTTDDKPEFDCAIKVDPGRNYSLWLHFAEIDPEVSGPGQRVFDVLVNGHTVFGNVDIAAMTGGLNSALVLNTTVVVSGRRTLTIKLRPKKGYHTIISAIELFELVLAESKTLPDDVTVLQKLKDTLSLPLRLGWNGDPCVPQQHPWSGVHCQYDRNFSKHVIDGLDLDNQGLRGFLPNDISKLHHLQSINMSSNSLSGVIPSSLGYITRLEVLDLSYNSFDGSIPESIGQLTSLRILDLNGNSLSGNVPAALGGRLLHGSSFNFTDNAGLCGIPGLPPCRSPLSAGAKLSVGLGSCAAFLLIATCSTCWWKRRQNILRVQKIATRGAPYAKSRTHFYWDVQMASRHNHSKESSRTAFENGPILLA